MSDSYFDTLETRAPEAREAALFEDFGQRLATAANACPGLGAHLADAGDLALIDSRAALQRLPLLTKADLVAAQQSAPPLGGFARPGALAGLRLFRSPGPVWEPQLPGSDPWNAARGLFAAGFRKGDVVHNAFGYHGTPGGFILDEGARALGCTVYPAGTGDTAAQLAALIDSGAVAFCGTPDYLGTILKAAHEQGVKLPLARAMVSGGPLFPAFRAECLAAGVHVMQSYATADLGVIAHESASNESVHEGLIVNEGLIVEICRPGSGEPVAAGETGEVVVTRLHPDYPLVRFATGDLSRVLEGSSACGRTNRRLAGWLGRADQRTKVRGQFVDPRQVQRIRAAHSQIGALRLLVERIDDRDTLTLEIAGPELPTGRGEGSTGVLADVTATLKRETGLSGRVVIVDAVPDDGTVVRDLRDASTP